MGGANKLLQDVDGRPIVRRVIGALQGVPLVERIVVTGADAEHVRATLGGLDVRFVHNPEHAEGIAASIRAGVAALPPGLDGVIIVPGDMPWLTPDDIAAVINAFDPEADRAICVPVRGGRRGNPVLWAARHFEALASLTGDTGGRQLFARLASEISEVPVRGPGGFIDVDTPAQLRAARHSPPVE